MSRVYCHRCAMGFDVRPLPANTDHMRCSDCRRPFFCTGAPSDNRVHAGVTPENADRFSQGRPEAHRNRVLRG